VDFFSAQKIGSMTAGKNLEFLATKGSKRDQTTCREYTWRYEDINGSII